MRNKSESSKASPGTKVTRRDLFNLAGAGIIVYFTVGVSAFFPDEAEGEPLPTDFNAFLRIGEDGRSGAVSVKRVVCAQDMGLSINPEGAVIQMEGCITMGMGYALSEDVHFKGGEIFDLNFDTYEIPRFSWLPEIETVILEKPEEAPQGGGEPAIVTMGAVLANAIFDACGARVLQMPMTTSRIKEALGG